VILKKLGKSNYINLSAYRLIALLNTLRKVLEVVILNKIKFITKTHNLLLDTQYRAYINQVIEIAL
jgi:hypothetical protein